MSKSGVIVLANRVGAGLFNFARLLRNDLVKHGHEVVVLSTLRTISSSKVGTT